MAKNWIADATKGGLHKALGISPGKKIPGKDLSVKATDSPKLKKEKNLAKTLKGFKK
jgi:hypothetical protein